MAEKLWGYKPSIQRKALRLFCQFLIFIFRINGRSKFSNELMQLLDPKIDAVLDNQKLTFRTGNGRLLWRANSLLTDEPLMISWIKSMQSDDVVLDVGANVGMYTVPIAKKTQTVYACELDPLNIAVLKENLYLNSVTENVVILPFACGDSPKIVNVRFRDMAYGDALQSIEGGDLFDSRLGLRAHSAKVLQFSLDDLFTLLNLTRPNKIKIDVDGNEATVLAGTKNLISGADEVYFEDSLTKSCQDMVQFLKESGFCETERFAMYSNNRKAEIASFTMIFKKNSATESSANRM